VLFACILFALVAFLSGCNQESAVKDDLTNTIEMLCIGETDNAYIYGAQLMPASPKSGNIGVTEKIMKSVIVEVGDVSIDGGQAEVTMTMASPNVPVMLENIVSTIQGNDVSILLSNLEEQLDAGSFPVMEQDVTVEMRLSDGHWYMIPNAQFSDAMTGGVVSAYYNAISEMEEQRSGGMEYED